MSDRLLFHISWVRSDRRPNAVVAVMLKNVFPAWAFLGEGACIVEAPVGTTAGDILRKLRREVRVPMFVSRVSAAEWDELGDEFGRWMARDSLHEVSDESA